MLHKEVGMIEWCSEQGFPEISATLLRWEFTQPTDLTLLSKGELDELCSLLQLSLGTKVKFLSAISSLTYKSIYQSHSPLPLTEEEYNLIQTIINTKKWLQKCEEEVQSRTEQVQTTKKLLQLQIQSQFELFSNKLQKLLAQSLYEVEEKSEEMIEGLRQVKEQVDHSLQQLFHHEITAKKAIDIHELSQMPERFETLHQISDLCSFLPMPSLNSNPPSLTATFHPIFDLADSDLSHLVHISNLLPDQSLFCSSNTCPISNLPLSISPSISTTTAHPSSERSIADGGDSNTHLPQPQPQPLIILLCGPTSVGKSTFIAKLQGEEATQRNINSPNASLVTLHSNIGEIQIEFREINEIKKGSEQKKMIKEANGAILMFDVSNRSSLKKIAAYYRSISRGGERIPIVLCGNKVDLSNRAMLSPKSPALRHLPYFDISLLFDFNLEKPLQLLLRSLSPSLSFVLSSFPSPPSPFLSLPLSPSPYSPPSPSSSLLSLPSSFSLPIAPPSIPSMGSEGGEGSEGCVSTSQAGDTTHHQCAVDDVNPTAGEPLSVNYNTDGTLHPKAELKKEVIEDEVNNTPHTNRPHHHEAIDDKDGGNDEDEADNGKVVHLSPPPAISSTPPVDSHSFHSYSSPSSPRRSIANKSTARDHKITIWDFHILSPHIRGPFVIGFARKPPHNLQFHVDIDDPLQYWGLSNNGYLIDSDHVILSRKCCPDLRMNDRVSVVFNDRLKEVKWVVNGEELEVKLQVNDCAENYFGFVGRDSLDLAHLSPLEDISEISQVDISSDCSDDVKLINCSSY